MDDEAYISYATDAVRAEEPFYSLFTIDVIFGHVLLVTYGVSHTIGRVKV